VSGTNDVLLVQGGPDNLTDDALRQVLARAPDRGALPDWQLRQTILQHAHDAVADQEALLHALREPTPWWRLDSWGRKGERRALAPLSVALAVMLLAGLAAVLWQRDPVPDTRARVTRSAQPLSPPAAATGAAASAFSAPPASVDAAGGVSPPIAAADAAVAPPAARVAEAATTPVGKVAATSDATPGPVPMPAPKSPAAVASQGDTKADAGAGPDPKRSPRPGSPTPPQNERASAAASASSPAPQTAASTDKLALRPVTPVAPAAPAPVATAKPTLPIDAAATAAPAPPSRPGERTDETPPPSFAALSQWTDMRIAYEGRSRTVPRAKARELGLLVGSAAIVADGPQRLRARTPWRVTLLRGGKPLAVLAIAQGQVQWTEGKAPPASGTPPPGSLDALRGALNMALEAPPDPTAELSLADRLERELAPPARGSDGQRMPAAAEPGTSR